MLQTQLEHFSPALVAAILQLIICSLPYPWNQAMFEWMSPPPFILVLLVLGVKRVLNCSTPSAVSHTRKLEIAPDDLQFCGKLGWSAGYPGSSNKTWLPCALFTATRRFGKWGINPAFIVGMGLVGDWGCHFQELAEFVHIFKKYLRV